LSASGIEAHGLAKAYREIRAVEALDLAVPSGVVLGFLGPNGAGKTTAIRMLTTVLKPDAGTFTVAGIPDTKPLEIRQRVGVLPELSPERTVDVGNASTLAQALTSSSPPGARDLVLREFALGVCVRGFLQCYARLTA